MQRAALYARVSTDGQREEATIDSQIEEIQRRIVADGNQLLAECCYSDDGYTGELLNRPSLDRLRDDAKAGRFEIVYVYDRGRLSRRYAYQEIIIEELTDQGIQFVTLHGTHAETAEERVFQAMEGVFHEYERVKISERFRRGRLYKVRNGKLLGYLPKYGYSYVPKTKTNEAAWLVDEKQAEVVRMICEWVAYEGLSARQVSLRLHNEGILPPKGRAATWTKGTIIRILRDETYIGTHYYNKTKGVVPRSSEAQHRYRKTKNSARRPRPRDEWMPVEVPPLISRDLFDRVQARLSENGRLSPRNTKREYLLRGLLYCTCGSKRCGEGCRGSYYYRCAARFPAFPFPRECQEGGVNVRLLDTLVWNQLVAFLGDPQQIGTVAEQWLAGQIGPPEPPVKPDEVSCRLKEILKQEERYGAAYGQGAISLDTLQALTGPLKDQRAQLEATLREVGFLKSRPAQETWSVETLRQAVQSKLTSLDYSDRHWVVRELLQRVTVGSGIVKLQAHLQLRRSHKSVGDAMLPIELTFKLPKPDLDARSYSRAYVEGLRFRDL